MIVTSIVSVHEANIDQSIYKKISSEICFDHFALYYADPPFSLFQDVEYITSINEEPITFDISNYPTKKLLDYENITGFEREDLGNIIKKLIRSAIYSQVLNKIQFNELTFHDPITLLSQVVEQAQFWQSQDLTPLLLAGHALVKSLKNATRQFATEDQKLPFTIEVASPKKDGYVCHIEDFEVYQLFKTDEESNVLLCKEDFELIKVKQYEVGRYVDVKFDADETKPSIGVLKLELGLECIFSTAERFTFILS